jgi:hypothetical protein
MTGYSGYCESAEQIEARKRRILSGYKPNLKVSGIPEVEEMTPLLYAALTPRQRRAYEKKAEAYYQARKQAAPIVFDRLGMALAIKRQYDGITPIDL